MKYPQFVFIFLFLLVFVVSTPSISAEFEDETDLAFQFNTKFDLKRPCFNNGTYCSSSSLCNVTILYPDGTVMINNQRMTFNSSFHNLTITQGLNDQLGFLESIQTCTDGNLHGADTYKIAITGDGKPFKNFPTQWYIVAFSFILISVGLINERLTLFKTAGSILMMIVGVLTLYPGYSFINYSNLFGQALGTILIALGFYFFVEHNFSREKQVDSFDQKDTGRRNLDDGRFHG